MRVDRIRRRMNKILSGNPEPYLVVDFYSSLKLSQLREKLVKWDPLTASMLIRCGNGKTRIVQAMFIRSIKEVKKL